MMHTDGPSRWLNWLYRRVFGRYEIDDPRSIAAEAPYTFFLPSENELLALAPGDLAKITIRSVPRSYDYEAERMWIEITHADGDRLIGTLSNQPFDMPQLRPGSEIEFRRSDVIDNIWADDRKFQPPPSPDHKDYWDRCRASNSIFEARSSCGVRTSAGTAFIATLILSTLGILLATTTLAIPARAKSSASTPSIPIRKNPKPVVVVISTNPWKAEVGPPPPAFVLYDDGTAIFQSNGKFKATKLKKIR